MILTTKVKNEKLRYFVYSKNDCTEVNLDIWCNKEIQELNLIWSHLYLKEIKTYKWIII